jgi:uncharacterized membrane protein YkgB
MNSLIKILAKSGLLKGDLDYHLVRASMVLIFLLFGYQKWFEYEAQGLIPFISNGPLTSWMYPVFGIQGASWLLGVSEWLSAALSQRDDRPLFRHSVALPRTRYVSANQSYRVCAITGTSKLPLWR